MTYFKKSLALLIAVVMILALGVSASAASIEVKNVVDNETYTAYKILNYTKSGNAVSYYLTDAQYTAIGSVLEAAGFAFTASSDGTQYFVNNGGTVDVSSVAAYLGAHTTDLGDALGKATATGANGSATFDNLATGYYFVTSSVGSLCALHNETDIATAVEKNSIPGIDKKEKVAAGESYVEGPIDANIGDTVNYQIVITDGTGTNAVMTMTDTMTAGLDYTAGSLKINGVAVADDADTDNWTVTVNGRVITIVFKAAYVASLNANDTITVTYDATINANAVIDSATGNENKVELDYSHQHQEDKVYVETYDFIVYKTDGTNFLDGAEFKLYDAATGGNQIKVAKDEDGCYHVDQSATASADVTIDINSATGCNVRGLDPGTYYLEEVVVPAGYNKLNTRQSVTITTGATAAVTVTVVNNAGTELPSTGGIGTTIFYVVGGLIALSAGIVLVTRRKVGEED